MASGWNLWVWLECIGVVIIIINYYFCSIRISFSAVFVCDNVIHNSVIHTVLKYG